MKMRPNARLLWCAIIILGSACYAVLCERDSGLAAAVALGYVAVLLTIFIVINVWKKPHDHR